MFIYYKEYIKYNEYYFDDEELKNIAEKYQDYLITNGYKNENIDIFNDFLIDDIIIKEDNIINKLELYQDNLDDFYNEVKKYM